MWYKYFSEQDVISKIREILVSHPLPQKLLKIYDIDIDDINTHLHIRFDDLDGKFAKGNGEEIVFDRKLLNDDFFCNHFHFVIHELYHWIKRRKEMENYFYDEEEVQSFVLAMVWELFNNSTYEEIDKHIYYIIDSHFENEEDSREMFNKMFEKAKKIYEDWK